ncbi:MAG TPA: response regulator transcription factor [Acidobacteriaceae bacterium]|nr:response regulator transcription factor [Acidobacteriaceae bacterium]
MTQRPDQTKESRETVFIVDDDAAICEGLCNLLESVGVRASHYPSAEAFLDHVTSESAGCLVLDVRLPGMTGVEFQEKLHHIGIRLPIVFMTAHGDIPMVRKVMKAGAVEFLTKPFQKEELLQAVEQAFAIDRTQRAEQNLQGAIRARIDSLTERERAVMALVTTGLLNKQIAAELNLSEITVKLHRRHVMEKMQAGSLADLVKMCERVKRQA